MLVVYVKGIPINVNITQTYAPTADSCEEDIQTFYNELDQAVRHDKSREVNILHAYFNGKVGIEKVKDLVENYGLRVMNETRR